MQTVRMTSTGSRFEYYSVLHNDFGTLYPAVNHLVIDLYAGPRSFILETGPAIDGFLKIYSIPGQPGSMDLQRRNMLDFIKQVDEFTNATMRLFEMHKLHVDRCSDYMQTVTLLDNSNKGRLATHNMDAYISLTPQLVELHNGLRELSAGAQNMKDSLQILQQRWNDLRDNFIP